MLYCCYRTSECTYLGSMFFSFFLYCRWKTVVHSVDGYSRVIVYLKCSNDNRAETVLQLFSEAVSTYGLPSRVRGDRGGENVRVADFMISQCGINRGSFISGRSIMWCDVFNGCILLYYCLFHHGREWHPTP